MAIEITLLQPGDEHALEHVAPGVFDNSIEPRAAMEYLADARCLLAVARETDIVVGFASGLRYLHPDKLQPELWVNEVGVAPAYQGQGIGKVLLRALLEAGRRAGCGEA